MSNDTKDNKGHGPKTVHFTVDGEKCEVEVSSATPNYIIQTFAGLDPTTHYLVKIHGNDRESYQQAGATPIDLHNGDRFQVISLGPTPVSDLGVLTGVQRFVAEMSDLGYQVVTLPNRPDHVVVNYQVETGIFASQTFQLGFVVPSDFPMTCPTGPMLGKHLRPVNPNGQHPDGAIHAAHAAEFQSALGGEWQYWSRPFVGWATSKKSARAYMNHIWRLMDSQ